MEKITYRAALTYVLAHAEMPKDIYDKLVEMRDSLNRKAKVDPEKEAEKQAIHAAIRERMTADWHTVTEWLAILELPKSVSNQKLTTNFGDLVDTNEVEYKREKGRSLYRKMV